MNRQELSLRKELAVMHLRVARAEIALARTGKRDTLGEAAPIFGALATFLEGRRLGKWMRYVRYALRAATVALTVRRSL